VARTSTNASIVIRHKRTGDGSARGPEILIDTSSVYRVLHSDRLPDASANDQGSLQAGAGLQSVVRKGRRPGSGAIDRRDVAVPFLKWAGGKRQLLPELRRFYPEDFSRYFEPFLGSGAVFFDLVALGRLGSRQAVLTDSNTDVIGCYEELRDRPTEVVARLRRLARAHATHGSAHYYRIRDRHFNPARLRVIDESPGERSAQYTPSLAAMLIYLNRTGFNGLFRINGRGRFNVPAGRYANPNVCDADNLRLVSRVLATTSIELAVSPFERVLDRACPGDFLYFDPPYAPVSDTARFTSYTVGGFSETDHVRLQRVVVELARRGCHVLVSNSTAPAIRKLYSDCLSSRSAGLQAHVVEARRAINCRVSGRGTVGEYLITNVRPGDGS
jgi:DNA adenine methylase